MSKENVEVVRRLYERWNHDPEGIAEALASGNANEGLALDLFDPFLTQSGPVHTPPASRSNVHPRSLT